MTHLSVNCRTRRDQPNRTHHCTGCDCQCHHVPAPANLRDLVEAAKRAPEPHVCRTCGYETCGCEG
jgi:hypothetical protein